MKNILIIEDDLAIRETVAELLEGEGYSVVSKENGKVALEYLKSRSGPPPSLILLDLMMPVMDGWEFRQRQVADVALASVPVVVITAAGNIKNKEQLFNVQGWIRKPIAVDELLEIISKLT